MRDFEFINNKISNTIDFSYLTREYLLVALKIRGRSWSYINFQHYLYGTIINFEHLSYYVHCLYVMRQSNIDFIIYIHNRNDIKIITRYSKYRFLKLHQQFISDVASSTN